MNDTASQLKSVWNAYDSMEYCNARIRDMNMTSNDMENIFARRFSLRVTL